MSTMITRSTNKRLRDAIISTGQDANKKTKGPSQQNVAPREVESDKEHTVRELLLDFMEAFVDIITSKLFTDHLNSQLHHITDDFFKRIDMRQHPITNYTNSQALDFGDLIDRKNDLKNAAFVAAFSEIAVTVTKSKLYRPDVCPRAEIPIPMSNSNKKEVLLHVNYWINYFSTTISPGDPVHLGDNTTYQSLVENTYELNY